MNASHVAGAGLGAIAGAILVALGSRIGLDLTNFDSAVLGTTALGVGAGVFHVFGKAWSGAGIFPSLRRGLFGAKAPIDGGVNAAPLGVSVQSAPPPQ